MSTISIAIAIAIAVTAGAGGYAVSMATTQTTICFQQPKATGLNDAERDFLNSPEVPATGHRRFP